MNEIYPLPQAFQAQIRVQLGLEADAYFAALNQPYVRGLRLNPRKPLASDDLIEGLGEPVPWQPETGRYLSQESTAGAHPLHEAGAYYIQEPSAMAAVAVLKPIPGERVLDLCAAPGGKSTQIADALDGQGLLVSNEPVPGRAKILSRNLERMGVVNGLTVSAEPEQLAPRWAGFFDAILVDAPCS
ncbi:MAG: RNA methyltransferase, partial [Candidatus Limiplasma sp.]|nr:RNA methyltransferase [Candidatus Limiplasma sp.]